MKNLFSFLSYQGRVRRLHWWLAKIAITAAYLVFEHFMSPPATTAGSFGESTVANFKAGANAADNPVFALFIIALLVVNFSFDVRRCHDRGRSGWFTLVGFIPLVGLWTFVELGFLDGTTGKNRFGRSPKQAAEPRPAA